MVMSVLAALVILLIIALLILENLYWVLMTHALLYCSVYNCIIVVFAVEEFCRIDGQKLEWFG